MSMWPDVYIETDEHSSQAKVHCMRCNVVILDHTYEMMPKRNDPKSQIAVYTPRKHSNYRQVAVMTEKAGKNTVVHVLMCEDCKDFALEDGVGDKLISQIVASLVLQARWAGYAPAAIAGMREKWNGVKVVKKLSDAEMAQFFSTKELANARNI